MVKLLDYSDRIDELLKQSNPFAIITAAHLKTKTTKNNPEERYSWKWSIVMALYERGFSAADILQLYRLIDWLMILPEDLSQRFTDNLVEYEEDKEVTYVHVQRQLSFPVNDNYNSHQPLPNNHPLITL